MEALDQFAESLAIDLLDARVIALQGLPRSGRSGVLRRVHDACGDSAVLLQGRSVTESNHRQMVQRVEAQLRQRMADFGAAQLIVDDFGLVMRSSFGHVFQGALRASVVDGDEAPSIGCLVATCLSDPVQVRGKRGSPLLAVAHYRFMPWYSESDVAVAAQQAGMSPHELLRLCGSNIALIDRLIIGSFAEAETFAATSVDRWMADLTPGDLADIDSAARGSAPYSSGHDRIAPLLFKDQASVQLAGLIPQSRVINALLGAWPSSLVGSASRFASRVGYEPTPMWVDRYLVLHPAALADFLKRVAAACPPTALRLLTTRAGTAQLSSADRASLSTAIADASNAGMAIAIRVADSRDVSALHARQLLLPVVGRAYQLPPEDRVLGLVPVGNESDSVVINPDWAISEGSWQRATPLAL